MPYVLIDCIHEVLSVASTARRVDHDSDIASCRPAIWIPAGRPDSHHICQICPSNGMPSTLTRSLSKPIAVLLMSKILSLIPSNSRGIPGLLLPCTRKTIPYFFPFSYPCGFMMKPWTCLSGSAPANQNSSPLSIANFSVKPVERLDICCKFGFSRKLVGVERTKASFGDVKLFMVIRRRSLWELLAWRSSLLKMWGNKTAFDTL